MDTTQLIDALKHAQTILTILTEFQPDEMALVKVIARREADAIGDLLREVRS